MALLALLALLAILASDERKVVRRTSRLHAIRFKEPNATSSKTPTLSTNLKRVTKATTIQLSIVLEWHAIYYSKEANTASSKAPIVPRLHQPASSKTPLYQPMLKRSRRPLQLSIAGCMQFASRNKTQRRPTRLETIKCRSGEWT